jgi:hypothetical protein
MRRSLVRYSVPVSSVRASSWADFITTTPVFKFSVHTRIRGIGFLVLFGTLLTGGANAQNQSDIVDLFGAMVRSGVALATRSEWERLSTREVGCVDQTLRQRGSSINTIIRQGINPSDPRIVQIRASCRDQASVPAGQTGPSFQLWARDSRRPRVWTIGDAVGFVSAFPDAALGSPHRRSNAASARAPVSGR